MKKIFFGFIFLGFITLVYSSCYYDNAAILYKPASSGPGGTSSCPDTAGTVSYSVKIVPVLQSKCYSCHAINPPMGNITMGTYAADKTIGLNGSLYNAITGAPGFFPMPVSGGSLSSCQILTVQKWISEGCPNN